VFAATEDVYPQLKPAAVSPAASTVPADKLVAVSLPAAPRRLLLLDADRVLAAVVGGSVHLFSTAALKRRVRRRVAAAGSSAAARSLTSAPPLARV